MNLEGRGNGLLTPSRNVLVEVEQKSSYALNSYWWSAPHRFRNEIRT